MSVKVSISGVELEHGIDYTLNGRVITFIQPINRLFMPSIKTRIKLLPDGAKFRVSTNKRGAIWQLQTLDHKKRMATITSMKSGITKKIGWGKEAWTC